MLRDQAIRGGEAGPQPGLGHGPAGIRILVSALRTPVASESLSDGGSERPVCRIQDHSATAPSASKSIDPGEEGFFRAPRNWGRKVLL